MNRSVEPTRQPSLATRFLEGGGELGALMRAHDWTTTPLGPPAAWPQSLKTAVRIMLTSQQPIWIGWGPQLTYLYNDPYKAIIGGKHSAALGQPFSTVWREIYDIVGPMARRVIEEDEGIYRESQPLIMERHGYREETYYTFSYSPIPDDSGGPGGLICANTDDTRRVIGERQLALLRELSVRTLEARTWTEACNLAAQALASNRCDLPFALIYLVDPQRRCASLAGASGIDADHPAAPVTLPLDDEAIWPIARAVQGTDIEVIALAARHGQVPTGGWDWPASHAAVVPITASGQTGRAGALIVGLSPVRKFDDGYRGFLDLVARQIAAAIARAQAYEEERQRAESLAELDKAKTAFFSNVSHEFRTPLTLMLGPLDDLLAGAEGPLSAQARSMLEVAMRSGHRLQKLVNTLLDFARIEAGRAQARFEPTDISALTADVASSFRSMCERAGIHLLVDCPALGQAAYVDHEMWEKIVLNLVSNAFKFTFEGEIEVSLRLDGDHFTLRVRDTGTGIPDSELPRMFERFHRVAGARGRSHEGSGIGLALVQELVRLHGGTIGVQSSLGEGTTFTVSVPLGSAHLPAGQVGAGASSTIALQDAFVAEAAQWLPESRTAQVDESAPDGVSTKSGERILVADDNADLRAYVRRLLSSRYDVEAVGDGEEALAAATRSRPDLVISDVMMPRLDGFGLLAAIRSTPSLATVPVILLSARAGEEARIEGLQHGADDYLVKPFSAREVMARVDSLLQTIKLREEARRGMQTFADAAPAMLWITDPDGGGTFLSRGWYEFTGQTEGEALGLGWTQVVHPDDRAASLRIFLDANQRREPFSAEYRLRRADGTYRWALSSGRPRFDAAGTYRGFIGSVIDIDALKQAQAAQHRSDERLRAIFGQTTAGIAEVDLEGRVTLVNPTFCAIVGRPADELYTLRFGDLTHPDDLANNAALFARLKSDRTPYVIEKRYRRSDGTDIWVSNYVSPVIDGDGSIRGAVAVVQDISERVRADLALRESEKRKDEFLATLSHELRNPLAPLRNAVTLLRHGAADEAAAKAVHDMIERQVVQLVRLVDDLLEVSRITRGTLDLRKEAVDVGWVVRNAIETSDPLIAAAGQQLTVKVPEMPLRVDGDPVRLTQVFANLLNNAAKYSEGPGTISVDVRSDGDAAVVTVKDSGVGLEPQMLPRIFEMFSRGENVRRRSQDGLGIGLALSRRLVEMHGGSIEARSAGPGKGSEFVVRLPLLTAALPDAPAELRQDAQEPLARRILVIDDNQDAASSLSIVLGFMGAHVEVAHDGPSGLAAFDSFDPAVVLLDIGMPHMDGYEVARRLRRKPNGSRAMLIALSGWGQDEDRRRSREAGFDHHLIKPADLDALHALLDQAPQPFDRDASRSGGAH